MIGYFKQYAETLVIDGKGEEKAVLTRSSRSASSNFKGNFVYNALLENQTQLQNGDICKCKLNVNRRGVKEKTFLVVSVRHADYSSQAVLYECNGIATIYRPHEVYNDNDEVSSYTVEKITELPVNHMTINDHMRLLNAGLLPSETKEFRMQKCGIKEMDRIMVRDMNGEYDESIFVVDAIDKTKFDGLLAVQTSIDNRPLGEIVNEV